VVRRTGAGWRARLGGAVSNRTARRVLVLVSIGAFLAVLLGSTVAAWFHQRGEIAALRDQVRSQEREVEDLEAERERWADPAYVEQQARQRLKFVRPGERSYTVLDPAPEDGVDLSGAGVAASSGALPWYEVVWDSTRTADAPGARR
jgi:cell division protein FtsB